MPDNPYRFRVFVVPGRPYWSADTNGWVDPKNDPETIAAAFSVCRQVWEATREV